MCYNQSLFYCEELIVIRSSLKDIRKAIKRNYPKPFEVANSIQTDSSGVSTFVVIKDFTDQTVAQFKYVKEDGALLTGFINSPLYQDKYDQNFPKLENHNNFDYYQEVLDLFHTNIIFKELFSTDIESFELHESMFKAEESVIRTRDLNIDFKKVAPNGFKISAGFQYYVNESLELKPRMKFNFEFGDFGKLLVYYDYETNELRFGETQFVDCHSFNKQKTVDIQHFNIPAMFGKPSFSNFFRIEELSYNPKVIFQTNSSDEDYQLFGIKQNKAIKTFDELELIFEQWMIEIGVLINKKFAALHQLDDTFEADSKTNVIENFNLIKMAII